MKTIPVSLIVAGILAPMAAFAQADGPHGPPPDAKGGRHDGRRPFLAAWKAADKDGDGFLSREEFDQLPRIQRLPEEKRAKVFARLDKNNDGKVAREELAKLGRPHGGPRMPHLWELDTDKSGGVSFEEFKAGRIIQKLDPEKQQALFKRLDTNGDGVISPQDHPKPPRRPDGSREHPGPPDGKPGGPRQMIRQLDQNGDGAVTFEEFRQGRAVKDLSEDEQEDRFEALDKNHDLKITAEDFPAPPPRDKPQTPAKPEAPPPAAQ